jgi:hypothetical protein
VARNQYKYLRREEREHIEKQRQAAIDIQRYHNLDTHVVNEKINVILYYIIFGVLFCIAIFIGD